MEMRDLLDGLTVLKLKSLLKGRGLPVSQQSKSTMVKKLVAHYKKSDRPAWEALIEDLWDIGELVNCLRDELSPRDLKIAAYAAFTFRDPVDGPWKFKPSGEKKGNKVTPLKQVMKHLAWGLPGSIGPEGSIYAKFLEMLRNKGYDSQEEHPEGGINGGITLRRMFAEAR